MIPLTIHSDPINLVISNEELFWIQESLRLKNVMRNIVESIGTQSSAPSFSNATIPK